MTENLIIYFSRKGQNYVNDEIVNIDKGNSEIIAEYIQAATGADMFEIETVKPYPEDYAECTEVAKAELKKNTRPALKTYLDDISFYKKVFIVGPCWWGTYPMAMYTQLERLNFKGKKVIPVMTHEGSGLGSAARDLKQMCRGAKILKGLAIQGSRASNSEQSVSEWAAKIIR